MSDAPEILWAEPDGDTIIIHNGASNLEALIATGYLTKYIRADSADAALRAKVARLERALTDMPKAVLRTTVCQGPVWPDDRPGVWLAALGACAKSVQAAVDAALTDGGKDA